MYSDLTSDQQDSRRCGHCNAPLVGRFSPCLSCRSSAVDAHAATAPVLQLALKRPQQPPPVKLAARKIWRLSSRASANRYDSIDEAVIAPGRYRRLREPLVLGASALVVTSAVYLGFIHGNDERSRDSVAVSGKVQAQHGKLSVTASQKPGALVTQRPSRVVVAQRSAPVPSPSASSPAIPASASVAVAEPAQRKVTLATSAVTPRVAASPAASAVLSQRSQPTPRSIAPMPADVKRVAVSQPLSPAEKLRIQASKHLRVARARLQENDLAATKSRLAAAIAAQPDNRDAQRMRSAVDTREEQRDALLSLARGCGYVGQWACVSRNASNALQIDASSKEAQRLVTRAMQESELQIAPSVEAAPEPQSEARDLITHH